MNFLLWLCILWHINCCIINITDFTAKQYSILVGSEKHSSDGPTVFISSSNWNTKNTAI